MNKFEPTQEQKEFEFNMLKLNLAKGIDFFQYFSREVFTEDFIRKYLQQHTSEGFTWRITDAPKYNEYQFVVNYYKPNNIEIPEEIKTYCENTKQLDFFERLFHLHNNSDVFRVDDNYFRYVFNNSLSNWRTVLGNATKNSGYRCDVKTWNKGENASIRLIQQAKQNSPVTKSKAKEVKSEDSYVVYLIHDGTYYKIGKTKNVSTRLKSLQTSSPNKLNVVAAFETKSQRHMDILEKLLHEHFENNRLSGEWFDISISADGFLSKCKELLIEIGLVCYDR